MDDESTVTKRVSPARTSAVPGPISTSRRLVFLLDRAQATYTAATMAAIPHTTPLTSPAIGINADPDCAGLGVGEAMETC